VSAADTTIGIPAIQNHIATYLNGLPIGKMASITRVAQHAYRAGPGLQNITGIELNEGSADVVPPTMTVIKAGQMVVSTQ
jgi:hypothetical protein